VSLKGLTASARNSVPAPGDDDDVDDDDDGDGDDCGTVDGIRIKN
jgi:hypothetical protein